MNTQIHLENLRKQIHISNKIDIIMEQSLKLMDIVNENQKAINELKEEQEQLKTHADNSTDSLKESNDIRGGW